MIRLFVGLPLPQHIRQHLQMFAAGLEGAHWVSPENMHLTLRFIGKVEEYRTDDINDALESLYAPEFELVLKGLETFGRGHMVHTIWAGVSPQPLLFHLQDKIESALVRAGLEPDHRKYTPHVTLARVRKSPKGKIAQWLSDHGGVMTQPFAVDKFVLYRSHLGNKGAYYETLAEYGLILEQPTFDL